MEVGRLIASLLMLAMGLFCVVFNKKIYEWNKKFRKSFSYKSSFSEKNLSIYIRAVLVIVGVAFIALGIYVIFMNP